VYKDNGDFFMWNGGYSNPVNYREKRKWVNNDHRVLANLSAMYTLNDNFFIKGTAAVDYMDMNEMKYLPKGLNIGQTQDYAERNPTWVTNYNANLTANYIKTVAEGHRLNVLVGSELQDQRTQYYSSIAYPGLTALPTSDAVQSSTVTPIYNGEAKNRATFVSFFARANYSIKDKYFLQLVARADGSSKFGVNKRFGTFPSVSGGWVISEERFLKGNKTLNFLKLRAGLGVTGNSDIPTNAQYETWSVSTFGYGGTPYRYQAKLGNPNLQWETSKIFDAALEFGLWKDRLTGTIGVYRKMSTNVLLQYNVQSSTGFSDAWSNAGKIKNQGIELTLHSNNIGSKHKLQWTTDLNISRNQNEVISIGSFTPDALSGGTNDSRVQIGKPVGSFYLVQYAGVDPATGKPMYYDLNGNKTYDYNLQNRQYAGAGLPKAYGGITNNFSYGRWSVNIFMTYSLGAKIFDSSAKRQLGVVTDWNMRTDLLDRWTQPGDESNHPRLTLNETNYGLTTGNPWWNTTLFIYKADYLRMKNIAITYNFKMAGKGLVKSLAVTGSVSNLFVITNFPGLDPELVRDFENAQDRNLSPNVTYLTPPQERSFNLTLNASF
jgi:TonB-linked SusC/RagA family outer membrane protein